MRGRDPQFPGNGQRRFGMVPGHHAHLDPGGTTALDRIGHFRPDRVDQADQAQEVELLGSGQRRSRRSGRRCRPGPTGRHGQHPVSRRRPAPRHGAHGVAPMRHRTSAERPRPPLDVGDGRALAPMHRGRKTAMRFEGNEAQFRRRLDQVLPVDPQASRPAPEEGDIDGIAQMHGPRRSSRKVASLHSTPADASRVDRLLG